jgi:hypothetical protein
MFCNRLISCEDLQIFIVFFTIFFCDGPIFVTGIFDWPIIKKIKKNKNENLKVPTTNESIAKPFLQTLNKTNEVKCSVYL